MKKYVFSMIMVIIMLVVSSVVFAQNYLENDPRYIEYPIGMGYISYIDTSSVNVQGYQPPQYIITINKIEKNMQDVQNAYLRYVTLKFKYDYTQKKMYLYSPNHRDEFKSRYMDDRKFSNKPVDNSINWDSEWQYIDPDVYYGEGTSDIAIAGEVAFAIAYNLKFHGERYKKFQNGFYEKLPNAAKIKNNL